MHIIWDKTRIKTKLNYLCKIIVKMLQIATTVARWH